MIEEKNFLGLPSSFGHFTKIYPPKVKDIIENQNYGFYSRILTLSQEELEDLLYGYDRDFTKEYNITPFQWILQSSKASIDFEKKIREAIFFYTKVQITFFYDQQIIFLGDLEKSLISSNNILEVLSKMDQLNEENFFFFQNLIRGVSGLELKDPPKGHEDARVKKIKAKGRQRDKIKASTKKGLDFMSCLTSICCMGIGITPLNIGELSYASVSKIIQRYQEKEKYDLDIKSLLAGADSKKIKPKYWIRKID